MARSVLRTAVAFLFIGSASFFSAKAITISSVVDVPCTSPPSGMMDWWPADNTTIDIQGGHNGKLISGATFATGKVGRAFNLNSANKQYVDVGFVDLPVTFTIDAWINPID